MYRVDLHAHTRFFHAWAGRPTAFDPLGASLLARVARGRGLDAVATTNHDYRVDFHPPGITFLPGIEISTSRGHVLVVGPNPPEQTEPGTLSAAEAVELAHDRDCAAILAHPFRGSTARRADARYDAVEANGKHPDTHPKARAVADRMGVPLVGGSDAHFPFEVGRGHTLVEADELTPASVVEAIRDGRVEHTVRTTSFNEVMGAVYNVVHRRRGTR